jgi:hypothetical protein
MNWHFSKCAITDEQTLDERELYARLEAAARGAKSWLWADPEAIA